MTGHFGTQIGRWRAQVLSDLVSNISEHFNETDRWFHNRPCQVQRAYQQNWPSTTDTSRVPVPPEFTSVTDFVRPQFVNIPAITDLLRLIDYTNVDQFELDCNEGFALIGPLPPGTGWRDRRTTNTPTL